MPPFRRRHFNRIFVMNLMKHPNVESFGNSHIRHSCAGRALLRWRKECGRLWAQLARAAQAPIHIVAYMYIDSYWFLPVASSVIITCIYHFPQIIIIFNCCHNDIWLNSVLLAFELFKSQQYWVQPYVIIQVIRTWHQPSLTKKLTGKSYRTYVL